MSPCVENKSKPVLKRSASLNSTTHNIERDQDKSPKKMCLRYKPYPTRLRRFTSMISSTPTNAFDENKLPDFDAFKKRRSLSRKRPSNINSRSPQDTDDYIQLLLNEQNSPKQRKLSILDVASRLKKSLTIGQTTLKSTKSDSQIRENMMEKDQNGESQRENRTIKSTCVQESRDNKYKEDASEREVNPEISSEWGDFFLPSFDDELYLPEMTCTCLDDKEITNTTTALNETEKETDNQITLQDCFLDNKSVVSELRKANTVILSDDKDAEENDMKFDNDFSLPPLNRVASCEGQKAKLEWGCLSHDDGAIGKAIHGYVDLEEALSNDWLNKDTDHDLTSLKNTSYRDLNEMQGTYTCSVCGTNLELEPFTTMDVRNIRWERHVFSTMFINGLSTPRSHDCDVILYCPFCCSDRVVFSENRLRW